MAVDKFSVSMPEDLLADLDELAAAEGLSRSGVLREAATRYVAACKEEVRASRRRASVDRAIEAFEEIAADWGANDVSGVAYLREVRGDQPAPSDGVDLD